MNNKDNFYEMINIYKGEGPYLYIKEKKFIDAASGTFNLPLGYTNDRIANKLKEQIDRCVHLSSAYTKDISEYLLTKLLKHTPKNINRMWLRDVSGSGAVEGAIRIAQKATGKPGVMSLFLSHHGQSLVTSQISGNAFRIKNFYTNIEGSIKIPVPDSVLSADKNKNNIALDLYNNLEKFIEFGSTDKIACLIIEPILGNAGNIVLPKEFYKEINAICKKHKILIIADEVQTGFGRTGTFFASTGYAKDLNPDIIVFAKGAGGIGIPVGGILMKEELDILDFYEHSSTSGANPLSLVALNEIINIIEEEKILENVQNNEKILEEGLLKLQEKYDIVENVRGIGYMFGFDVPTPEKAAQIIHEAEKQLLIIRGSRYGKGKAIKVRPPLICTQSHLNEILTKLDLALSKAA